MMDKSYHGGCLICEYDKAGNGVCNICKYKYVDWSMPNMRKVTVYYQSILDGIEVRRNTSNIKYILDNHEFFQEEEFAI
jgi:hypothetical protein